MIEMELSIEILSFHQSLKKLEVFTGGLYLPSMDGYFCAHPNA